MIIITMMVPMMTLMINSIQILLVMQAEAHFNFGAGGVDDKNDVPSNVDHHADEAVWQRGKNECAQPGFVSPLAWHT
jgi:hypothetical protein